MVFSNIIRYNRQYNNYSCGPVAILNSLKWGGRHVTYGYHYPQLAKDCRLRDSEDGDYGTSNGDFDRVLREHGSKYFTILKPRNCTYLEFEQHIKDGGAAVLCFLYQDVTGDEGHFAFYPEYNEKTETFLGVNDTMRETFTELTREDMKKRFLKRKDGWDEYPRVWLLTKRNNV